MIVFGTYIQYRPGFVHTWATQASYDSLVEAEVLRSFLSRHGDPMLASTMHGHCVKGYNAAIPIVTTSHSLARLIVSAFFYGEIGV